MQVKETDNNKTLLNNHQIDMVVHRKVEDMDNPQWMVACHLNSTVYLEDTVLHHKWEELHKDMVKIQTHMDHQWVKTETQEEIWNTEAECLLMAKECMVRVDLQATEEWIEVATVEWIEVATVEWVTWEWVDQTLICHNINNMEHLQFQANMVALLLPWAAQVKLIKVVHQIQWIHVEAILINSKMALHQDIFLKATAKEVHQEWVTWEDMANHHKVIHLHLLMEVVVMLHQETSLPQPTSIRTQWKPMVNHQACQTLWL